MLSTSCFASQMEVSPETAMRSILNGHLICLVFFRLCRLCSLQFVTSVCLSLFNLLLSQMKENADMIYVSVMFTHLTFQAVKMVIMHAPEPELRKKSFAVLKGVSF